MGHPGKSVFILAAVLSLASSLALAQDLPSLAVSPTKANMLIGETRTFRAVGKDGKMRHHVRWSITPEHVACLTLNGDEVTLHADAVSRTVVLAASVDGDSAEAEIEILGGTSRLNGSVIWSLKQIPGCKDKKMTQAAPSATGPDLYVEEDCPQGTIIRAVTHDGREMWRRLLDGRNTTGEQISVIEEAETAQHLAPRGSSVCDAVSVGMTREDVDRLTADRCLHLSEKQRAANLWVLEEESCQCAISFDATNGTVIKKKKTVVTD